MKKLQFRFDHFLFGVLAVILFAVIWNTVWSTTHRAPAVTYITVRTGLALPANATPDKYSSAAKIPRWTRVDTPAGYPSLMRACLGTDGMYVDQFGVMYVVPGDPECHGIDPPK